MCPLCLGAAVMYAAGATSAGGVATLVLRAIRLPGTPAASGDRPERPELQAACGSQCPRACSPRPPR